MINVLWNLLSTKKTRHSNRLAQWLLIPLMAIFATGCLPEAPTPFFDKSSGNYPGTIYVGLNPPDGASQIYYTLDGTEPGDTCLQYTGSPIAITQTTVLKVKYSIGFNEQPIQEASYTIGSGGGGGGGALTNESMLQDWSDAAATASTQVEQNFNGGCTLVVQKPSGGGCAPFGGVGNLDQLNKWYFVCNNGAAVAPISGASVPAVPAACGGEGYVLQGLFAEGLGGKTDFIFNDYEYPLPGGGSLIASGHTVGHFDLDADGGLGTDEGAQIVISGMYDGTIDSSIVVDNKSQVGGFYVTNCTNSGCSNEPSTYLISPGPVFTLFEPGESSCTKPWYVIQNKLFNLCVTRAPGANAQNLLYSTCTAVPNQQWQVSPVQSAATNDYVFELADGSGCLTMTSDLFLKYSSSEGCTLSNPDQAWYIQNVSGGSYIKTPHNHYGDNKTYCMNAQFGVGPTTTPLLQACNNDGAKWTFLANGALPAINPLNIQ